MKIFGFSQNFTLHREGRESAEISISHKKLHSHRPGGGSSPPDSNFGLTRAADLKKYLYKYKKIYMFKEKKIKTSAP